MTNFIPNALYFMSQGGLVKPLPSNLAGKDHEGPLLVGQMLARNVSSIAEYFARWPKERLLYAAVSQDGCSVELQDITAQQACDGL